MFPFRDHNPSGRVPYVTYALIVMNCGIFLSYWGDMDNARVMSYIYGTYAVIPAYVTDGNGYLSLVTSMFLHAGFMHLAGNMLFLHIFGDNLEDEMGHVGFLLFYLASGIAAALVQVAFDPTSQIPMVGASGAIAGVMGGYLLLYPRAKVDVILILIIFFKIFSLSAWIVLGVWFALQVFGGLGTPSASGGVAYWAHIGGFVAGFALCLPVWSKRGGRGYWDQTHGHPPHPEAQYAFERTTIPKIRRPRQ